MPRSLGPIDVVRRPRYPWLSALPAQRTKEVSRAPSSRDRRNSGPGDGALRARGSVVLACRGRGSPSVQPGRRRVRGRSAPRRRHRRARRLADPRPCLGNRDVCGIAANVRPRCHDPHGRRVRRHARPPRHDRGREGRLGRRGRHRRHDGLEWDAGAPGSHRPPRHSAGGRRRGVRRSARVAARANRCDGSATRCSGGKPCTGADADADPSSHGTSGRSTPAPADAFAGVAVTAVGLVTGTGSGTAGFGTGRHGTEPRVGPGRVDRQPRLVGTACVECSRSAGARDLGAGRLGSGGRGRPWPDGLVGRCRGPRERRPSPERCLSRAGGHAGTRRRSRRDRVAGVRCGRADACRARGRRVSSSGRRARAAAIDGLCAVRADTARRSRPATRQRHRRTRCRPLVGGAGPGRRFAGRPIRRPRRAAEDRVAGAVCRGHRGRSRSR